MFINSIILNNYRIYKDENRIDFSYDSSKNVYIISGDNGFGKTTFLTSIFWCFFGKLIGDVDEKFKKEVSNKYGYKGFAKSNLNKLSQKLSKEFPLDESEKEDIFKKGYSSINKKHIIFKNLNEYSVSIIISDIFIPSIPCNSLTIKRSYDSFREKESVQILIDGAENELTKEVGPEIFINDFVISKDIAKFFFFDSEKIDMLAEMSSIEDKRKLSIAYSEVLGLKKYEDLKSNIENLRVKLRRKSSDIADKEKLDKLLKDSEDIKKLIDHLTSKLTNNDDEIIVKRQISEQYQEKLIREGNLISLKDLMDLKSLRETLKNKDIVLKSKLKDLLELAPFVIAGRNFVNTYNQMLNEKVNGSNKFISEQYNVVLNELKIELNKNISANNFNKSEIKNISKIIDTTINKYVESNSLKENNSSTLLDLNNIEQNEFKSIFDNIKFSYNLIFKQTVKDERNNRIFLSKTNRKISQAESNDNDILIKEIKTAKEKVEKEIIDLEKENRNISESIGSYQKEYKTKLKLISELSKKTKLFEIDQLMDDTSKRLINELNILIIKLKNEKKLSLEINIKLALNILMHKTDFIHNVQVEVNDDIIDIRLFDSEKIEIEKDMLSKGEKQLYATAILKALVEESNIKFPVFIDSPLQKFDIKHSKIIIRDFYPSISEQVVVFPLLGKELTEKEYNVLLPNVKNAYLINNKFKSSYFKEVNPKDLFNSIKK